MSQRQIAIARGIMETRDPHSADRENRNLHWERARALDALAEMDADSRRLYLDCCHRVPDHRGGWHYYDNDGIFLTTEWTDAR